MEKRIKNMLPYLGILAVDFYLLPFFMQNTGAAMLIMLCIMPLIALLVGVVHYAAYCFISWSAVWSTAWF